MKKAVCLISGGLDSAVTSFIAKDQGYEIYGLSFCYGQRHNKELEYAKKIGRILGVKDHVFFNLDIDVFKSSSLVDRSKNIQMDVDIKDIGKDIPVTYVPGRNTVFLSIGLAYAETVDAEAVFIGVTSTDYSGYPDCRPEFIKSFQKMANICNKKGVEGNPIKIVTPLLYLNKSEIIKKGISLEVPFEYTWSCYLGEDLACGRCDSCQLRLKGFKNANLKDPLNYR